MHLLNNRGSQNRALGDTWKKVIYTLLAKVLDTLDWMYFSYDLKSPFDLKVDVEMLESRDAPIAIFLANSDFQL